MVTIALLNWNQAQFLSECLVSIEEQTYENFELLIVDNGSVDQSVEILKEFRRTTTCTVKLTFLQHNVGIPRALNLMLNEAGGQFFLPFASDDVMLPYRLQHQVELFSSLPQETAVLGSAVEKFGDTYDSGQIIQMPHYRKLKTMRIALIGGSQPPAPGAMIRVSDLRILGGYDEACPFEDFDCWLRLVFSLKKTIQPDPTIVARYRIHGSNSYRSNPFIKSGVFYSLAKLRDSQLTARERREVERVVRSVTRPRKNWNLLHRMLGTRDFKGIRRVAFRSTFERGLTPLQRLKSASTLLQPKLAATRVSGVDKIG